MVTLKPLSQEAIPRALEKAERYRLLNEPAEAESICLDILQADPGNQEALVMLILALTDRFAKAYAVGQEQLRDLIPRLTDPYERAYYSGVICERRAKAQLQQGSPGSSVYEWIAEAMTWYEKAEAIRPPGNEDAILRWNTCARILQQNSRIAPAAPEPVGTDLEY